MREDALAVTIGSLRLKNPVMVASGTFGFGREYAPLVPLTSLGAIVTKGVSLVPWPGNPPPRLVETPSGMLNSIGLENPGVEKFIAHYLPELLPFGTPIIVNVAGHTIDEYVSVATRLQEAGGVSALELNISCPNINSGGMAFGTDPCTASALISAVRKRVSLPLIVKLSPNVTDIAQMARIAENEGADAVSLVNTFLGMAIDTRTGRPVLGNVFGGLSGPAIRPIAVRMVWQVYQAVHIPIIGMGGITCAADALEFVLAGATAVAIGTALFADPGAPLNVIEGLKAYLEESGKQRISELVGLAHGPGTGR